MYVKDIEVAVLGHILNEKIIFPDKTIFPVLGSPAAYSSTCMASLGIKVGIVTKIGKDYPEKLIGVFNELNIDKEGIIVGEYSSNNELIYDENGDKALKFLTKAEDIKFEDIPKSFLRAKIYYICPMDYEIDANTIKNLSKFKNIIAVDLGGYGGGTSDTHPVKKDGYEIKGLCNYFDIVKLSAEDCFHIFGTSEERIIANNLLNWGVKICVITLGQKGSFLKTKNLEKYIPPFPSEKVIDRTGAGDCFGAGFLASYLKNGNPILSAIYGTAVTSYIIERSGGVIKSRMPLIKEAEDRVNLLKLLMN
ncbi:MAG: carbohydrate kinase family protein [Actinobacteria bacterium]|nr:carbohydrate kinase family protein [Actinomycetota bacterium]